MTDCDRVHGRACRDRQCTCMCHDGKRRIHPDVIAFLLILAVMLAGCTAWAWYAGTHGIHR